MILDGSLNSEAHLHRVSKLDSFNLLNELELEVRAKYRNLELQGGHCLRPHLQHYRYRHLERCPPLVKQNPCRQSQRRSRRVHHQRDQSVFL